MNKLSKLAVIGLLAGAAINAQAQVKYKITRKDDLKTYVVSMVSEQSLKAKQSITGTAQVTVRVKSEKAFVLNNLTSLNQDADWDNGSTLKSPDGARDYDYLSFNLKSMGTRAFNFVEGQEIQLFTFQNAGEQLDANVELINNDTDELASNPRTTFNVRNHVSVFGFGLKNAYTGNIGNILSPEELAKKLRIQKVFPNPALDKTTVVWENLLDEKSGDLFLTVVNAQSGQELLRKKVSMGAGQFSMELAVGDFQEGNYLVHIEKDGMRIGTAQKLIIAK